MPRPGPLDSRAFLPAYIRARQRWGRVFDERLSPLLLNQQNPSLPPFSLNAPLGSDFQNYYPQLYNEEKSAIATVLGSLNPIGTVYSAFRQWQLNDDILLTSNVNSIEYSLLIDKDNVNLISWAIHFSQSGNIYFEVAPIGSNQLVQVARLDQFGDWSAGNYPSPIPQIGGWLAAGTYTWNVPSWVSWIKVYCTGGGGGGGSGYRGYSGGGGGASGQTIIGVYKVDPSMNPFTVQIGAGGLYNFNEGAPGNPGEVTAFYNNTESIYVGAWGGGGGLGGGANSGNGGLPNTTPGTGGVLQFQGNPGERGAYVIFPTYDTFGAGGNGGSSYWGGAGWGGVASANIANAGAGGYEGGGGGGGAQAQYTGYPAGFNIGGVGGAGVLLLEMYG